MNRPEGCLTVRAGDILVRVRAKPGARTDRVAGVRAGELVVEVRAAPERGKANDAVARALAQRLGLRASEVSLKHGAASPRKTFVVPTSARRVLERLVEEVS